jgi:hypothetical protein
VGTVRIPFDEKEAIRYFGARAGDQQAALLVNRAFLFLRNELQPRSVRQHWRCRVTQGCGTAKGTVELENGTVFHSSTLARHLKGCSELLLFGATLGSRFDTALRQLSYRSIAEGAAAQAVGAALIESYCDEQEKIWKRDYPDTVTYRPRFSPGYGDWDLSEQEAVFRVLNCAKAIGLTLTEGGLMAPIKSVTAVIGMDTGKDPDEAAKNEEESGEISRNAQCALCGASNCPFRREG